MSVRRPEADLVEADALAGLDVVEPHTESNAADAAAAKAAAEAEMRARVGISTEELAMVTLVLAKFDDQPPEVIEHSAFRAIRHGARMFIDALRTRAFRGGDERLYEKKLQRKRERNARQCRLRDLDRKKLNTSAVRAKRIAALSQLVEATGASAAPALMLTDGRTEPHLAPALLALGGGSLGEPAPGASAARAARASTAAATIAPFSDDDNDGGDDDDDQLDDNDDGDGTPCERGEPTLHFARSCYTCKSWFDVLHPFYGHLCPGCAALNWDKRHQRADLAGKIALVTGARVKIGYQVGLRLLHCGATVIATSRFPHDTALRYSREPDFAAWRGRLHVYGLDLRDLKAVVAFTDLVQATFDRLDIIINNAAQTVRRPPLYYKHLMTAENVPRAALEPEIREVVRSLFSAQDDGYRALDSGAASAGAATEATAAAPLVEEIDAPSTRTGAGSSAEPTASHAPESEPEPEPEPERGTDIEELLGKVKRAMTGTAHASAALSQVAVVEGDDSFTETHFPRGLLDVDGQQVDLRRTNSWLMRLHEVSVPELLEVFAINALAPFIIDSRLKALMERTAPGQAKHIVNVSAMEGKFYRTKSAHHPHTNMAKAALNMLTRTSAQDYKDALIYMNAVDTGWITDESPLEKAAANFAKSNFVPPIDELDAAARILDPVLAGFNTGNHAYGLFLKDYVVTEW